MAAAGQVPSRTAYHPPAPLRARPVAHLTQWSLVKPGAQVLGLQMLEGSSRQPRQACKNVSRAFCLKRVDGAELGF